MINSSLYDGIHPDKLPKVWFKYYVVYKYRFSKDTYIVGFNTDLEADNLQKDLLSRPDLTRCEILGHYPRELLENGKSSGKH